MFLSIDADAPRFRAFGWFGSSQWNKKLIQAALNPQGSSSHHQLKKRSVLRNTLESVHFNTTKARLDPTSIKKLYCLQKVL